MSRPVVFRPQAESELISASEWYDERSAQAGREFRADVETTIQLIGTQPEIFARIRGDIRHALLRRFPYAIYFQILDDHIVILAVMHGHRDPDVWRSRR